MINSNNSTSPNHSKLSTRRKNTNPFAFKFNIRPYSFLSFGLAVLISFNLFSVSFAQVLTTPTSAVHRSLNQHSVATTLQQAQSNLDIRVSSSSDDAEERVGGGISLTSSDLELVFDSGGDQVVGMRFNGINIPPNAIISNAYIQFQVDETNSVATSLTIHGEDTDNAATFTSANWNISSRPMTDATVLWSPVGWTTTGAAGVAQQTPDISSIIQEIVKRSGWVQNNSLAIIISGTGERGAEAFDGDQAGAPLLHVEYMVGNPPQVSITNPSNGAPFIQGDPINFSGIATDIEDGDISRWHRIRWFLSLL
jgi:hypothetical protein